MRRARFRSGMTLAAFAIGLLLSTPASALEPNTGSEPAAFRPNVQGVTSSTVLADRYLYAPIMVRSTTGRLHTMFGRGDDHYWKGKGSIGHAYSDDDGHSWVESADAATSDNPVIHDRFGSFGASKSGKLIGLFLRRPAPGQKPIPYQVDSTDDGRSWTSPRPATIQAGVGGPSKYTWPYPYGAIRRTPSGVLVVMAYVSEDNSVLISRDDGASWVRNLVVWSERPNYSEMGLKILDESTWLAVSRIDGEPNRMAQFLSRDAGTTWTLQGDLDLPSSSDLYAAPTVDDVQISGQRALLLSYCDRRPKVCEMRIGSPGAVTQSAHSWGPAIPFVRRFYGRSGYQTFVTSRDGNSLIGALMRERNNIEADIAFFRTIIPSK